MQRRSIAALVALVGTSATLAGCRRVPQPDAYGNVEATEIVVSAEAAGRLLTFTVNEGDTAAAGAVVATIDATQLNLEREQVAAQRGVVAGGEANLHTRDAGGAPLSHVRARASRRRSWRRAPGG
jgi:HlyD family secretion protein